MTKEEYAAATTILRPNVLRYYTHLFENEAEAAELIDKTFADLLEKLDQYDQAKASLSTWICTALKNNFINMWHKQQADAAEVVSLDSLDPDCELLSHDNLPSDFKLDFMKALQALPPTLQLVASLHLLEGYTRVEIADMAGVKRQQVDRWASRINEVLRERLGEYVGEQSSQRIKIPNSRHYQRPLSPSAVLGSRIRRDIDACLD